MFVVTAIRHLAELERILADGLESISTMMDAQFDAPLRANLLSHKSNLKLAANEYKKAHRHQAQHLQNLEKAKARAAKLVTRDVDAYQSTLRDLARAATTLEVVRNDHFDRVVAEERRNAHAVADACAAALALEDTMLWTPAVEHVTSALVAIAGPTAPAAAPASERAPTPRAPPLAPATPPPLPSSVPAPMLPPIHPSADHDPATGCTRLHLDHDGDEDNGIMSHHATSEQDMTLYLGTPRPSSGATSSVTLAAARSPGVLSIPPAAAPTTAHSAVTTTGSSFLHRSLTTRSASYAVQDQRHPIGSANPRRKSFTSPADFAVATAVHLPPAYAVDLPPLPPMPVDMAAAAAAAAITARSAARALHSVMAPAWDAGEGSWTQRLAHLNALVAASSPPEPRMVVGAEASFPSPPATVRRALPVDLAPPSTAPGHGQSAFH
ncbi:hypothetical protein AMAG_02915 [Allomyces macrogynus ATCC 38327]|uniref:IMD domain-containing protein n=1 Tax=Allomyces macrogynus (strain ATCC 38327) TaxID=578462 RepID=A0A0L0S3N1_ALLM3|nr:hypothetical protein AMAG_02915 [Allomyces macrogynus ATCC 38327]|eukprot:KNE57168.1 hypothetical protein AMAG_02915 [Allomyces macrogynus ATCC 38327]